MWAKSFYDLITIVGYDLELHLIDVYSTYLVSGCKWWRGPHDVDALILLKQFCFLNNHQCVLMLNNNFKFSTVDTVVITVKTLHFNPCLSNFSSTHNFRQIILSYIKNSLYIYLFLKHYFYAQI